METRRDHMLRLGSDRTAQDKTEVNRIMLNFRPIAPKPPSSVADSATCGSLLNPLFSNSRSRRSKRKYVRTNWHKNRTKGIASSQYNQEKNLVMLRLLPEKDDSSGCEIDLNRTVSSKGSTEVIILPDQKNREPSGGFSLKNREADLKSAIQHRRIVMVESWVTVERVTGACKGGLGLRMTDEERLKCLEGETCPGMVSDGEDRVVWVNEAYKRMVMSHQLQLQAGNDNWVIPEMTVWLVIKPGVAVQRIWAAFSCSVRVRAWREGRCCTVRRLANGRWWVCMAVRRRGGA